MNMGYYGSHYGFFPKSKSKGERIADAEKKRKALEKKGTKLSPVVLKGSKIAATFWGKAWCDNIESYRDYAYRLERGRSYVRSNSVIDLQITAGKLTAQVMGSELYRVEVAVKPVPKKRWAAMCRTCAGKIGSLVELLRGGISGEVMEVMTRHGAGLFPEPAEISFSCSCPDVAGMCKHVAAVMYGVGNRLDTQPELLFLLRGVDSADLMASALDAPAKGAPAEGETVDAASLSDVFGVDVEPEAEPTPAPVKKQRGKARTVRPTVSKAAIKKGSPRKPTRAAKPARTRKTKQR
jgi:uncharacterized Zn finger protein